MVADLAGQGTKEVSLVVTQVFPSLIHFTLFSFFVFIAMFGMIPMWNDLFLFYQESGMNLLALEEFFFFYFFTCSSLQDWDTCLVTVPFLYNHSTMRASELIIPGSVFFFDLFFRPNILLFRSQ